jgi:predicted ATP-grasp superfamily ATP-dependent carboligase
VRDPFALAGVFRQRCFRFPPTVKELSKPTADPQEQFILKKPVRSCGGLRIQIVGGPQPASAGYYYQDYVRGSPWSAVFASVGGKCQLLGVSRQIEGEFGKFIYRGSIAAGNDFPDREMCLRLGALVATEFELRGLFNIDLIHNSQGWWPLEVNPRYSASIEVLERATGLESVALHAAAFDNKAHLRELPPRSSPAKSAGKAIVYADGDGRVPRSFDRLVHEWHGASAWPGIADLPRIDESIKKGQPVCSVFAEGESDEEVARTLNDRIDRVQQVIASGRIRSC